MPGTEIGRACRYHFASIDTWLQGECRSCCAEHDWRDKHMACGDGRSVFDVEDAGESDGDAAGDD